MGRKYSRPELNASDLKLILSGRVVVINPDKADVASSIKKAEKGCRKNKLDVSEAEAAWDRVTNKGSIVAGAGKWSCPKRYGYDMQGTVIVFVRLSDSLVGMSCERQAILPGSKSKVPLSGFNRVRVEEKPVMWFNGIAELFWSHLSEEEIADLKQQAALKYLHVTKHGSPLAWSKERKKHLDSLKGLQDPVNVSELQVGGKRVAKDLAERGLAAISWRDLKKREPSLTSKYQRELLEVVDSGLVDAKELDNLPDCSQFNLRFSVWRGDQRIFKVPQLVLEVESYELLRKLSHGNEHQREVARFIRGEAAWEWHPGKSNCVGWFRVHIDDDKKLCFIDEIQSDVVELVTDYLRKYSDDSSVLTAEEKVIFQRYLKTVKQWHVHGFSCLSKWCDDIGYTLAMHSRESAQLAKVGMTPSDRKWNTYYAMLIKRYSMESVAVEGYPASIHVGRNTANLPLHKKAG